MEGIRWVSFLGFLQHHRFTALQQDGSPPLHPPFAACRDQLPHGLLPLSSAKHQELTGGEDHSLATAVNLERVADLLDVFGEVVILGQLGVLEGLAVLVRRQL